MTDIAKHTIDDLLNELRTRFHSLEKSISIGQQSATFTPIAAMGERIRIERKRQKLTQEDLSQLAVVAYGTVSKIEKGEDKVQLDNVIKVAEALGLKLWLG